MVSKPAYAQGAIAKVARMAERTPFLPTWANCAIFSVVAFAAIAAALSKPQMGSMLMPLAFDEMRAAKKSVKAQVASVAARIV